MERVNTPRFLPAAASLPQSRSRHFLLIIEGVVEEERGKVGGRRAGFSLRKAIKCADVQRLTECWHRMSGRR